jgi:hypothetical protein
MGSLSAKAEPGADRHARGCRQPVGRSSPMDSGHSWVSRDLISTSVLVENGGRGESNRWWNLNLDRVAAERVGDVGQRCPSGDESTPVPPPPVLVAGSPCVIHRWLGVAAGGWFASACTGCALTVIEALTRLPTSDDTFLDRRK